MSALSVRTLTVAVLALSFLLVAGCGDRDDEAWGLCSVVTDTRFDAACSISNREGACGSIDEDADGTVRWHRDYPSIDECAAAAEALRSIWRDTGEVPTEP